MTQAIVSNHASTGARPWVGTAQIITAAICWGTLGVFSTYLHDLGFTGWQIATLRIVTAAVLVLVMLPRLWPQLIKLTFSQWLGLGLQSLIGVLGMTVCYFFAVLHVGAGPAVALLYTAPIFSLVFSQLLLNERITRQSALLALMAVIGVGLTMAGNGSWVNWGIVLGLLSGLCYSLYGVLGKRAMHHAHAAPLIFFTSILFSALLLLCIPATYHTYAQLIELPTLSIGYVLGLSVLGTITPFWLYMKALETLPASRASVFTIFEPLTAIVLAMLLLQQHLAGLQYLGIVLILLAALLNAGQNATTTRVPRWLSRRRHPSL